MKENFETKPVAPSRKITVADIQNESLKFNPKNQEVMNTHIKENDPLESIQQEVKPIDFRKEAEIGEKGKIMKKHYIVLVVEAIIRIAGHLKLGICTFQDNIYAYNNMFWERVEDERFMSFLGKCAQRMGVSYVDSTYYENLDSFFKQFRATGYFKSVIRKQKGVLINLLNGTFEIGDKVQKLREFRAEDFLTYQLPFEYSPDAKCPQFEKYLNRVLPDIASQYVVAEFIGSAFINGSTLKLEKALMPYGSGANGKSVLFEIVNALFGVDNVSNYALDNLTDNSGYTRAMFSDKLLNYSSEVPSNLNPDRFKQMVSGEPMEARHPYGRPFQISQYPKIIVNVNELPRVTEHTEGFFRRLLIIPFEEHISESEQDKELANKIISTELSGVFNWVLEGLQRLLENKNFTYCEKSEKALMKYKLEADNVGMFLDENGYKADSVNFEFAKRLYPDYSAFCQINGYKAMSMAKFRSRLESKGIRLQRINSGDYRVYISKVDKNLAY
ncbi:DNA primase [Maribellus sp. CM-23]|uniref:DNA primase family protein n=1 Tax=Maribellus sp. CM-23 TaxID=2781026 RepID=UPI001F382E9D|nr:phage/plasmid primase, P4 family [Maribellus sp. CM-23]MCE4564346.1 DNA primase [Maribellus sp. CM-23]